MTVLDFNKFALAKKNIEQAYSQQVMPLADDRQEQERLERERQRSTVEQAMKDREIAQGELMRQVANEYRPKYKARILAITEKVASAVDEMRELFNEMEQIEDSGYPIFNAYLRNVRGTFNVPNPLSFFDMVDIWIREQKEYGHIPADWKSRTK
jgi:hypothetical protein